MRALYRACLSVLPLVIVPFVPAAADEVVTLETRAEVTQSFLLLEPEGEPAGIVVMFPGHEGVVEFTGTDAGVSAETDRGGFTASEKTRSTYLKNGLVVALMAPPSDRRDGIDTAFRSSREHVTDVRAVIGYLNKRYEKAPYLHGHCRSSFSPASVATQLGNEGIAGLILSSPRSRGRHGAVTDYRKGVINIPVLLIQHKNDPCGGTPYENLDKVKRFYESSVPKVDVIVVSGGDTGQKGAGRCQNGAHSFRGLQTETADAIAGWIMGKDFQTRIGE